MVGLNDNIDKLNLDQSWKHWPYLFEPYGRFWFIFIFCLLSDQDNEFNKKVILPDYWPVLRKFTGYFSLREADLTVTSILKILIFPWLRMIQPSFVFMVWSLNVSRRSISNIYCKNIWTCSLLVSKCSIRTQTDLRIRVIPFPAEITASYKNDIIVNVIMQFVLIFRFFLLLRENIRLLGWKHIVSFIIHHESSCWENSMSSSNQIDSRAP